MWCCLFFINTLKVGTLMVKKTLVSKKLCGVFWFITSHLQANLVELINVVININIS